MSGATIRAGSTGARTAASGNCWSRRRPIRDAYRSRCCSTGAARWIPATPNKLRYGRRLTALLRAIARLRSDPVRIQMLADGGAATGGLLSSPGLVAALADEIERLPSGTTTELARSVVAATIAGTRVELTVLISDCLVAPADLKAALSRLARTARSAALVQLLDPAEAVAGPLGAAELRDHETGELLRTLVTEELRERYARCRADTEAACAAAGVPSRAGADQHRPARPRVRARRGRGRDPARAARLRSRRGRRGRGRSGPPRDPPPRDPPPRDPPPWDPPPRDPPPWDPPPRGLPPPARGHIRTATPARNSARPIQINGSRSA
jgi:hypothetical protein